MLFYPAALPLSRQTLDYAAGIIRRYCRQIGSCWRKLNPGRQALLVLAYLRKGETFAELAAGFAVGNHDGLAVRGGGPRPARGPDAEAPPGGPGREEGRVRLRGPGRHPDPHRPGSRRPALLQWQAQEARHEPAGHRQPRRDILWVSGPLPGSVNDKKAEWIWGILAGRLAKAIHVLQIGEA